VTFNSNDTMTYVPKRRVQAEPEISPRDAHVDRIIVPNIALLVSCPSQREVSLTAYFILLIPCIIINNPTINVKMHKFVA
jgi:hypothetical protein